MRTAALLKSAGYIKLNSIRGRGMMLRPAFILSARRDGEVTMLTMLDGSVIPVKEPPETVASLTAAGGARIMRKAFVYSFLKDCASEGESPLAALFHDEAGKAGRVEALKSLAYGRGRSSLPRLLEIYGNILRSFCLFKFFGDGEGKISNYEAELARRGADDPAPPPSGFMLKYLPGAGERSNDKTH
jgi:hypothetical protein